MDAPMELTSWRGLRVEHPADWELALASGPDGPWRMGFVDRRFQRMDVRWKVVTYVPKLDLVLSKHRDSRRARKGKVRELTGLPEPWQGLLRRTRQGRVVHAGRFFRDRRWLAEVTFVWPERREAELERQILASIRADHAEAPTRLWQAMGLSVILGSAWELTDSAARVGRVDWTFRPTARKDRRELHVERIALVDAWLAGPLGEWLEAELPENYRLVDRVQRTRGRHRAERLIARAPLGRLGMVRATKSLRLETAWHCDVENRVYRVSLTRPRRDDELALPGELEVRCCRPAPQVRTTRRTVPYAR